MRSKTVLVSLVPRWRAFAGDNDFTTIPMDVSRFSEARLRLERGDLGSSTSFLMHLQESADREVWTELVPGGVDPDTAGGELHAVELTRQWLRVKIELRGADARVSCYAEGILVARG